MLPPAPAAAATPAQAVHADCPRPHLGHIGDRDPSAQSRQCQPHQPHTRAQLHATHAWAEGRAGRMWRCVRRLRGLRCGCPHEVRSSLAPSSAHQSCRCNRADCLHITAPTHHSPKYLYAGWAARYPASTSAPSHSAAATPSLSGFSPAPASWCGCGGGVGATARYVWICKICDKLTELPCHASNMQRFNEQRGRGRGTPAG